ncbi:MAG: o-succinylbenzoate synthase, partial [Planctomycetota bacterium]
MKIQQITLREIRLSLREPFQISSGTATTRRILLLELQDESGTTAWSECAAGEQPNYSPETIDTAWLAIREWLAPRVLGQELTSSAVHGILETDLRGHNMAKAAVEMGAWALEAEVRGQSLSQMLGGTRERIEVGISIGIQESPEDLAAKVSQAHAQGYRRIKMKIKPGADLEFVAAARQAVGTDVSLMVDANSAYTLKDGEHLANLDELHLIMIEQPLAWNDVLRHSVLQEQLQTPICLDECITGLDKAEEMLALRSGKIINIKPSRVGGFTPAKQIHDFCQKNGIPVWCGGMLESGIGRAHNVALASLPNFTIPGDISPSARYW